MAQFFQYYGLFDIVVLVIPRDPEQVNAIHRGHEQLNVVYDEFRLFMLYSVLLSMSMADITCS